MSIRSKLILSIGCPLVILLAAMMFIDHSNLKRIAYQSASDRMSEVAERVAAAYNAELRSIQHMAETTARFFAIDPDLSDATVYDILLAHVQRNPVVYGSCAAFEPGALPRAHTTGEPPATSGLALPTAPAKEPGVRPNHQAPYVFRAPGGIRRMDIAEAYDYRDGSWAWYDAPRTTGAAGWTEPYFDQGAGNVDMVTFSAPILRDGRFAGVVTVDVRLESLRSRIDARLPPGSSAFMISRTGVILMAPDPSLVMRDTVFTLAQAIGEPEAAEIGRRMMAGERGTSRIPDFVDGRPNLIFYAPITATGWSVAGSVPEETVTAEINDVLLRRLIAGVGVIAVTLGIVVFMGTWLVRPIGRLAKAVRGLGAGDLDSKAVGVTSRDEIGELALTFNGMVDQLQSNIDALTRETAAREAMERELKVARDIQMSMIPHAFPTSDRFAIHGLSSPARQVGGDFFDVFPGSDGRLIVVMADVSGKGIPAAMFMVKARTLLRSLAAESGAPFSPGELLRRCNEALIPENDSGLFVTIFIGEYDPADGRLRYANAAHLEPVLIGQNGRAEVFGGATGTVVGVIEGLSYEERARTIGVGDSVVLYTDGVTEARSPAGAMFELSRLVQMLPGIAGAGPSALCERILERVTEFQGPDQADDITVLVLARTGRG